MDKILQDLYYTPGLATTYGGIDRLWRAAKRRNNSITKTKVRDWLLGQDTYTLHKRARKKLSAEPRVYVKGMHEQWCLDLCDVTNISDENDGYNFILTCIDVLSKKAWAEPVKRKTGPDTAKAFQNILDRAGVRPQKVETDQGKEFYNVSFGRICRQQGIHHFSTQSSNKASVVERFNRSLKELMWKYFYANNTVRWREILGELLDTYNTRKHRSIGMALIEVNEENEDRVYKKLYAKKPRWGKKYNVGDMVRISRKRHVFEKGYLPNFTEEIFKIRKVIDNHPPFRYELEDMAGENIVGRFSSEEIQKSIKGPDDLWKIEKIIRRIKRRGEILYEVKWKGFPQKFNSLVRGTDIVNLQQLNQ